MVQKTRTYSYEPGSKLLVLGMVIQALIGTTIGLIFPIPYYMEISGVDRPDPHIYPFDPCFPIIKHGTFLNARHMSHEKNLPTFH